MYFSYYMFYIYIYIYTYIYIVSHIYFIIYMISHTHMYSFTYNGYISAFWALVPFTTLIHIFVKWNENLGKHGKSHIWRFWQSFFFNVYLVLRETERAWAGEGQREREGRLQALSCQHRAWRGAWIHELRDHDLSLSRTLNWLSHPGAPRFWQSFLCTDKSNCPQESTCFICCNQDKCWRC